MPGMEKNARTPAGEKRKAAFINTNAPSNRYFRGGKPIGIRVRFLAEPCFALTVSVELRPMRNLYALIDGPVASRSARHDLIELLVQKLH